jgi:hypothetical protein
MTKIDIGVKIDLEKLIDTRALIQANSGGGKSVMVNFNIRLGRDPGWK